jgi:hypothetical protein
MHFPGASARAFRLRVTASSMRPKKRWQRPSLW